MADIIACLVSHCQADGTLTALVPSAKIGREYQGSTALPQLYFAQRGGEDESPAVGTERISVLVMAAAGDTCIAIHNRLRQLFHFKSNYTLGASPNTAYCYRSMRVSAPEEESYDEPAAREWQAFYEFTITQPHGF